MEWQMFYNVETRMDQTMLRIILQKLIVGLRLAIQLNGFDCNFNVVDRLE